MLRTELAMLRDAAGRIFATEFNETTTTSRLVSTQRQCNGNESERLN